MARSSRWAARIRTAVWVGFALLASVNNLVFSALHPGDPSIYLVLSLLGAFTVPFVLVWRRRLPERVLVITTVAALILTIGSSTAWIALGSLIRRRTTAFWKDPWQWGGAIAVTAATYLAVVRDMASPDPAHSLTAIVLGRTGGADWASELPFYTAPLIAAILMAIVLGIIAISRARTQAAAAVQQEASTRVRNLHLQGEIARYEERERIARELHDSLGNALASVSLLSGAVRAQADDPAAVSSHAQQLQFAVQEATSQMHDIVRTYRSQSAPVTTLSDLHELVAQNQANGALIYAEIDVQDSGQTPGAVERAVYRVVQELLTNATKHAPGHTLTLRITGKPSEGGIRIVASNPIPVLPAAGGHHGATGPDIGSGSGIIGAAERVEQLGGWLHSGAENGQFVVQVWVPWHTRPGG